MNKSESVKKRDFLDQWSESLKKRKRNFCDQLGLVNVSQDSEDPEGKEIREPAKKKRRSDNFEQPICTGLTKLNLQQVGKLIQDCLNKDTFNNIAKPVDPQIGDLYIYRCETKEPVHALDKANWRYTHRQPRQDKSLFQGRTFYQSTFARSSGDRSQKKIILFDEDQGLVVVHYRTAIVGVKGPLSGATKKPRNLESRQLRKEAVKAVNQLSPKKDLEVKFLQPPGDIEWADMVPSFMEHLEESELAKYASNLLEPTCEEECVSNYAPSPLESTEEGDLDDLVPSFMGHLEESELAKYASILLEPTCEATSNFAPSPQESTEEGDLDDLVTSILESLEERESELAKFASLIVGPTEEGDLADLATSNNAPSPLESTGEDDLADELTSFLESLAKGEFAHLATSYRNTASKMASLPTSLQKDIKFLFEQLCSSGRRYAELRDERDALEDQIWDIAHHMQRELSCAEDISKGDQKPEIETKLLQQSHRRYLMLRDVRERTEAQLQELEDAMREEGSFLVRRATFLTKCVESL
jgi:hypothetical protein